MTHRWTGQASALEQDVDGDQFGDRVFNYDRVFDKDSRQIDVYNFTAAPIVEDAMNG